VLGLNTTSQKARRSFSSFFNADRPFTARWLGADSQSTARRSRLQAIQEVSRRGATILGNFLSIAARRPT
jgi:hypothetical protein